MSEVQSWSVTAASNNSASPDGWPESMAPSGINNSARENMAAIARWYKDGNGSLSSGGSANAYTLSPNRTIAAYAAGVDFLFIANHDNTGAATLNVSSLGVKDLTDRNADALVGGEIEAYGLVHVVYDATNGFFRAVNILSNAASTVPSASETVEGTVELATAAETLTGSSTTLALTPGGFAGNKTLSATGYYKFPGGFIIQWGPLNINSNATATSTFAIAFPTACQAFIPAIYENSSSGDRYAFKIDTLSASSAIVRNTDAVTLSGYYIAVGY